MFGHLNYESRTRKSGSAGGAMASKFSYTASYAKQLWSHKKRQFKILDMVLAGKAPREIAKEENVSPPSIISALTSVVYALYKYVPNKEALGEKFHLAKELQKNQAVWQSVLDAHKEEVLDRYRQEIISKLQRDDTGNPVPITLK